MTDPQNGAEADNENPTDAARAGHPGLPRWVKLSAIVVVILVVAVVAILLIAGGEHGPGRHGGGHAAERIELPIDAAAAPAG